MAAAKWQPFLAKGKVGVTMSVNVSVRAVMEIVRLAETYGN